MELEQRPNCPHAPHDYSCGPMHEGHCALVHRGGCEAVHPICPACYADHPGIIVTSVAAAVRREGVHVSNCSDCEKRTLQWDADLFCTVCKWFVPDVNERLAERYAAHAGNFPPVQGVCPDCGLPGAGPELEFSFLCSKCGSIRRLGQGGVSKTSGVTALCADCGGSTVIPPTIWCPGCQLNLRNIHQIGAAIKAANEVRHQVGANVKEPPIDQVARRVGTLALAGQRRFRSLTETQQSLILNRRHLDLVLLNEGKVEDWILDIIRLRSIGYRLDKEGGMKLMQAVHGRVTVLNREAARSVELWWDQIGDWQS